MPRRSAAVLVCFLFVCVCVLIRMLISLHKQQGSDALIGQKLIIETNVDLEKTSVENVQLKTCGHTQ